MAASNPTYSIILSHPVHSRGYATGQTAEQCIFSHSYWSSVAKASGIDGQLVYEDEATGQRFTYATLPL